MKSAVFLYNAQSGRGRIRRNVERVCDVFREGGYDILPVPIDFDANPFDGREHLNNNKTASETHIPMETEQLSTQ